MCGPHAVTECASTVTFKLGRLVLHQQGFGLIDVERLIRVLHRLVDAGHSVVVIEHDLDVVAEADWVIALGVDQGVGLGSLALPCTYSSGCRKTCVNVRFRPGRDVQNHGQMAPSRS